MIVLFSNTGLHAICNFFLLQISTGFDDNQFRQAVCEETEFLIECGISKINWNYSEMLDLELLLCKSVVIYLNKAALDQFLEGLQLVGLLKYVKENPASLKEFAGIVLFCTLPFNCGVFQEIVSNKLYRARQQHKQSSTRGGGSHRSMVGRVSIDNLDQTDPEGLLPQLLIFITGADNIPVLGFHKCITSPSHAFYLRPTVKVTKRYSFP